jgi:hypothetical protein
MNAQQKSSDAELESDWQKTPFANLLRYKPSGTYFARLRVKGKLIRRSLKTKTLSVAKLRLADLENAERKKTKGSVAVLQGKMTFEDALAAYKQQRKNDPNLKPGTIDYDDYRIKALLESWPDLENRDVSKISDSECRSWSEKNAKKSSSSSHNHTVGILRRIFKIAVEAGARYDNPALAAKWVKEHTKEAELIGQLVGAYAEHETENSGDIASGVAGKLAEQTTQQLGANSTLSEAQWSQDDQKDRQKAEGDCKNTCSTSKNKLGDFPKLPIG